MQTEDGHIVYKCLNGDSAAFGLLVDKYKASIYALAYSKLHNFHDAEDITQEAFIKAYRRLNTLRWWDSFLPWLYAITANLCKDWLRSQAKRPDHEFSADYSSRGIDSSSVNRCSEDSACESVHEALDMLPEAYRQVLTLYYLGGMNTREIARFLGTSPSNISHKLSKARARMKEEMIAMMSTTYGSQRLQASFTFRIVETVKRIRVRPLPRIQWLPWGMSLATGLIIAVLSFTSPLASFKPVHTGSMLPASGQKTASQRSGSYGNSPALYSVDILSHVDALLAPVMTPGSGNQSETTDLSSASANSSGHARPVRSEELLASATTPELAPNTRENVTISGKVLRDDMPVPNARVFLYDWEQGKRQVETTTQADGSFLFEIPALADSKWRRLTAVAYHPRHSFGWTKFAKANAESVVISLHSPIAMAGTVVDEAGEPIEDADVKIGVIFFPKPGMPGDGYSSGISGNAVPARAVRTDANGKFIIPNLPAGTKMNIYVTSPRYARKRTVIQTDTGELVFRLKLGGSIEGRVTFGETGEPVKGIRVYTEGAYLTDGWAESWTDEKGHYTLTNLPAGDYNVFPMDVPTDLAPTVGEYIKVAEGQVTKNVDLQLVKGELATGRITDKDTSEPIKNHGVHLVRQNRTISSSSSDENGVYYLRATPGKIRVFTSAPAGYQDVGQIHKEVDVIEGQTVSDLDFQFEKGTPLSLTGRVITFDGEPVAGAVITDRKEWYKEYGRSDGDGSFTIAGLRPGQRFSVKAEQGELQLRGYADLEAQPDTETEILMERYELTSVSGRVVNKQGEPIPSAKIGLHIYDKQIPGRSIGTSAGMANSKGEYEVAGLIIGDEYSIRSHAGGYREGYAEKFTAAADMPPLEDIVLLPRGNSFLEGTVTDTDGNLVVGARVTCRSEMHETVHTDENGHYRIDGLSFAITPRLNIDHPDYGLSEFWYVPTNQTQDFVLAIAEGYLNGTVIDADGNPVDNAIVGVGIDPDLARSGHFNLGSRTNGQGEFQLKNLLVNETESISISKGKLSRTFRDVKMNRDGVEFVLEESQQSKKPPEPVSAEEAAKREYVEKQWERREKMPGQSAPELDVAQWLRGEPVTVAELKGKVVLLHFWSDRDMVGMDAVRHRNTLRLVNTLQNVYGEDGLVCIGIYESTSKIDELEKLLAEKRVEYRTAVDRELSIAEARGATFDKYAVFSSLSFILIDANGVINSQPSPYKLEEKIRELISD